MVRRTIGTGNVKFKYIIFRGEGVITEFNQGTGTVVGQANAASAIAVGAALYTNTPEYGVNPPTVATFSSRGGVIANGTNRNKPDIIAPNGVNTTVNFGGVNIDNDPFPNFFGTSASAPHAAGVAALMMEANQKYYNGDLLTGAQTKTILKSTAVNMDVPGDDVSTGSGLIKADDALQSLANPFPIVEEMYLQDSSFTPGIDPVSVIN